MALQHYSDLAGKPFYPGLVSFFSSGPIIAMVRAYCRNASAACIVEAKRGTTKLVRTH
jgi:nucleoside diphosphate kinase